MFYYLLLLFIFHCLSLTVFKHMFSVLSCTTGFFVFFYFFLFFFLLLFIIIIIIFIFYVNHSLYHNIVVNDIISVCILIELHVCKYTCLL